MKRRIFLKGSLAAGTLAVAAGAGMLTPTRVLAATWPKAAFESKTEADALNAFFGTSEVEQSDQVSIKAPLQAENGAVVPIKVMTSLEGVEAIAIITIKNPSPYTTSLQVAGAGGLYSTRIKMGQTSPVNCYVKAGGKLYLASQEIKVTVGGCGG
ncbi:MAG TPA: thiosulfate oxidation carrier protein SoxY [Gammaproteobacteria bacterium]|jgi:sulfur-oxidizing protein SoxY|nr:thiosulfate oxidation carrier protein SoxY [Acidiferrobacteraceae bacterium]MDP6551888.1 thiosulfate oxidation carrier protein SoxY [Arenicellales bacterium]MDP6791387.1 thiosulfate oxidation carrier protein SoxY [Arenicellales bacterium]MDP6919292.1 thiosulfate oxidation carrier protein SoxY [Arenicellales bacterium]HCX86408.1 thiosulfate oxidation carrier protein SoxY [Gammaproteobacteria bacterium]|tara:strand:+ start:932 stop:1396 length:465 start_codon:yes stop_codon:yes gene_type:complete